MSYQRAYRGCINCFNYSTEAEKFKDPKNEIDVRQRKSYLQLRETACHFTMRALEEMGGDKNPNSVPALLLNECSMSCDYTSPIVAELLKNKGLMKAV